MAGDAFDRAWPTVLTHSRSSLTESIACTVLGTLILLLFKLAISITGWLRDKHARIIIMPCHSQLHNGKILQHAWKLVGDCKIEYRVGP